MNLDVRYEMTASDWDRDLCALGGTVFHSSSWLNFMRATYPNARPVYFMLRSDTDDVVGVAAGVEYSSTRPVFSHLSGTLAFDALPLVVNNDRAIFREFIERIEKYVHSIGYTYLVLGSFHSRDCSIELANLGYHVSQRMEFELSLSACDEELWASLEAMRRRNVKKARRLGVRIYTLPIDDAAPHLRRLQAASAKRILSRGGPDIRFTGNNTDDPVNSLLKSRVARIVGAEIDGHIVSAILFSFFNSKVYLHVAGHGQAALESQAPTLLLWESIVRFRSEGATHFNLGGCALSAAEDDSPEHGVYVYKKGFGTDCIRCSSGRKIANIFKDGVYSNVLKVFRR